MNRPPVVPPPAPSRREVLEGLTKELTVGGVEAPRQEAERLLAYVLGETRGSLLLCLDTPVEPSEAGQVATLVGRRLAGVPLQHLEGTVAFRDLILLCDHRALIPRPETEQLVEQVAAWAAGRDVRAGVRIVRRPKRSAARLGCALDIGTGSGAIALSLVGEGIVRRAVGLDMAPEALEQATENRGLAGLEDSVEFRAVDRFAWDAVPPAERYDVIVSNPPYVSDAELADLPREVLAHEPRLALTGGSDGLDVVREIAHGARRHLRPAGGLFLEIGSAQGSAVQDILLSSGPWNIVEVRPDLAGHDRFAVALA